MSDDTTTDDEGNEVAPQSETDINAPTSVRGGTVVPAETEEEIALAEAELVEEVGLPMSIPVDPDAPLVEPVEGKTKQEYLDDAAAHRANNRPEAAEEAERLAEDAPDEEPAADDDAEADDQAADDEDVPYIDWTAEELRAELDRRNADGADLAVSGTKADLAERLEADDAAE